MWLELVAGLLSALLILVGDLILSLTKDTYLELGLEGKSSTVQPGARHST